MEVNSDNWKAVLDRYSHHTSPENDRCLLYITSLRAYIKTLRLYLKNEATIFDLKRHPDNYYSLFMFVRTYMKRTQEIVPDAQWADMVDEYKEATTKFSADFSKEIQSYWPIIKEGESHKNICKQFDFFASGWVFFRKEVERYSSLPLNKKEHKSSNIKELAEVKYSNSQIGMIIALNGWKDKKILQDDDWKEIAKKFKGAQTGINDIKINYRKYLPKEGQIEAEYWDMIDDVRELEQRVTDLNKVIPNIKRDQLLMVKAIRDRLQDRVREKRHIK